MFNRNGSYNGNVCRVSYWFNAKVMLSDYCSFPNKEAIFIRRYFGGQGA